MERPQCYKFILPEYLQWLGLFPYGKKRISTLLSGVNITENTLDIIFDVKKNVICLYNRAH